MALTFKDFIDERATGSVLLDTYNLSYGYSDQNLTKTWKALKLIYAKVTQERFQQCSMFWDDYPEFKSRWRQILYEYYNWRRLKVQDGRGKKKKQVSKLAEFDD